MFIERRRQEKLRLRLGFASLERDTYWGLRLLIDRYRLGINGRGIETKT